MPLCHFDRALQQMTKLVRFTIRDILWLTVVVALIAGWGLDHWRLSRPVGSINGRICLDGKPVAGGWILFQGTGQSAGAKIDANNGEFQIAFIPAGRYTVAVENTAVPTKYA